TAAATATAAAAADAQDGTGTASAPTTKKTAANADDGDQTDARAAPASNATSMPVAAVVVANTPILSETRSSAGNADGSGTAIGAQTKTRTQPGLARTGDQNVQGGSDAAPAKSEPRSNDAKATPPVP